MTKTEIRAVVKELKKNMPKYEIQEFSRIIIEQLIQTMSYKTCSHLFCYVSFNEEVMTTNLIKQAIKDNKKVAVPKIVTYSESLYSSKRGELRASEVRPEAEMKFYSIASLEELTPGTLGILEPVAKREAKPQKGNKNLFIVPGLAFDEERNRIGYGKGFYDSYFSKYKNACGVKIALAYDYQIFPGLPVDFNDERVDKIITQSRIII